MPGTGKNSLHTRLPLLSFNPRNSMCGSNVLPGILRVSSNSLHPGTTPAAGFGILTASAARAFRGKRPRDSGDSRHLQSHSLKTEPHALLDIKAMRSLVDTIPSKHFPKPQGAAYKTLCPSPPTWLSWDHISTWPDSSTRMPSKTNTDA
ncbi:uncharacterized protein LOC101177718 [Nomascus leucogenys]|uniref:uncharacterized protein LOC101177718 n=1 Tax=Nomascus leucogenys TaxID=61853 RepID=UPI00122D93CB|nr:uncharacterized protein LOC101177718 [Nomascus leucogenys]